MSNGGFFCLSSVLKIVRLMIDLKPGGEERHQVSCPLRPLHPKRPLPATRPPPLSAHRLRRYPQAAAEGKSGPARQLLDLTKGIVRVFPFFARVSLLNASPLSPPPGSRNRGRKPTQAGVRLLPGPPHPLLPQSRPPRHGPPPAPRRRRRRLRPVDARDRPRNACGVPGSHGAVARAGRAAVARPFRLQARDESTAHCHYSAVVDRRRRWFFCCSFPPAAASLAPRDATRAASLRF